MQRKRSKASLRKIKILMILMLLTLIMAITATYAWFSSQREVEISTMRINVEVAESLQISLDGETWTQSIAIADMKQFYGTYTGTGDSFTIYQAKSDDNNNYVPKELKPVSTIGEVSNGAMQFVTGDVKEVNGKSVIETLTLCSETDITASDATISSKETNNSSHPYLVFEMYLKNTSAKESDPLLLNTGSKVRVTANTDPSNGGVETSREGSGTENTGLEYSARIGFVAYKNTAEMTASGETVRALTADASETDKATAAIWEPNHLEHITEVVKNNSRVGTTSEFVTTYGIKAAAASHVYDGGTGYAITDVNAASGTYLDEQKVFKTSDSGYTVTGGTTEQITITDVNGDAVELEPNKITKVRVYIWLEGQDPDCISTASLGDRLLVNLRLTKAVNNEGSSVTYTEDDDSDLITASTLATEEAAALHYGGYVTNYTPTNGVNSTGTQWRIFHSNGTNIYLIADDYVPNTYAPAGNGGTGTAVNTSGSYKIYFTDIVGVGSTDYTGWSDISSTSIATKWLSQYVASGYTSTNYNMKATAYLLDTTQWSGFANSSYADYAVGGPTLELFTASYNATHTTKTIETQANTTGYQVKWSTSEDYATYITGLSTSESLYVIRSTENANAMWVASPSATHTAFLLYVSNDGKVHADTYSRANLGARPIVSLKSNVKIEKQEDGTYKII